MRIRHGGLLALLLLCGCSSGPSGSDIKVAMQEIAVSVFGAGMAPTVEDVTDVNCKEAQGKPGYVCSFKATTFNRLTNSRVSETAEGRFVQNGSKWVAMNDK